MLTTLLWRFCCFSMGVLWLWFLDEFDIALLAFRLYLVADVLLFLYVYPHEVILDISNIVRFAF